MVSKQTLVLLLSTWLVSGQRPSFAGFRPIGYPAVEVTDDPLGNRFGDSTEKLPVEAKGDRNLIDRLSKLPIDQQPFWYINWKAIEENNKNPQTYPQRPNSFTDPSGSNPGGTPNSVVPNNQQNPADLTSKFGTVKSQTPGGTPNSGIPNNQQNPTDLTSKFGTVNSQTPGGSPNSGIPNNQQNPAELTSKSGTVNSSSGSFSGSPSKGQTYQLYKYFKY